MPRLTGANPQVGAAVSSRNPGPCAFFVYGTLKSGQMNEWLLLPYCSSREVAWIHGQLYDVGTFPALVEGAETVHGEIVRCAPPTMMRALAAVDDLEAYDPDDPDSLYLRRVVNVYRNQGESEPAFAYFYNLNRRDMPGLEDLTHIQTGWWDGPTGNLSRTSSGPLAQFEDHVRRIGRSSDQDSVPGTVSRQE